MTLGQRIQEIRFKNQLSQEEFGERLNVTRQTVSKWELDQALPELSKIVMLCRIFAVTADSLLIDGITTFGEYADTNEYGVYRSELSEIVLTERFAVVYYKNKQYSEIGAKCYIGNGEKKFLSAVCHYDGINKVSTYAFTTEGKQTIKNSDELQKLLGEEFDKSVIHKMRRLESFTIDRSNEDLPRVSEIGIKKCLSAWRCGAELYTSTDRFHLELCTGKTEYVFSVIPTDTNIYCGASYNIPFDLGLFSGGQFFRFRNYRDNTESYCKFFADFSYEAKEIVIPTEEVQIGACVRTGKGLMWCLKRYNDDEIVLEGCGGDEYVYRRESKKLERYK